MLPAFERMCARGGGSLRCGFAEIESGTRVDVVAAQNRAADTGAPENARLRRVESHFVGHGGVPLFRRSWLPEAPVRALVLVHGFGEHSGRYEHVAAYFAAHDCAVFGFDLRGHGRSAGKRGHVDSFSDYLNDLEIFLAEVKLQAEQMSRPLPITLLGHSMGGLIATAYAVERHPETQSLVTSGAALELSSELSGFKITLAKIFKKIAPRLSMNAGLDANLISSDADEVKRYIEDPLVHGLSTASHAVALIDQIERVRGRGAEVQVPVFMTHGSLDRLCPPDGSVAFHQSLPGALEGSPAPLAELRMYASSCHEILNDVEREQVMADMLEWILHREHDAKPMSRSGDS